MRTFHEEVIQRSFHVPVLVDFWASWCGPCRSLAPHLDALSAELADKLAVVKIEHDKHPALVKALRVTGLPSLLVFKNGVEVDRLARNPGSRAKLRAFVQPWLP